MRGTNSECGCSATSFLNLPLKHKKYTRMEAMTAQIPIETQTDQALLLLFSMSK
jgi:hypothetical protein